MSILSVKKFRTPFARSRLVMILWWHAPLFDGKCPPLTVSTGSSFKR
ncbi:MAG: hypothetical protein ACI9RO_001456, partial [Alteromonas macleodii]